ncbi:MAG: hypothetical protein QF464_12240, partial [Myxococcota bacterium]|nr:hypothetical protein [Myxococcota bacterium]
DADDDTRSILAPYNSGSAAGGVAASLPTALPRVRQSVRFMTRPLVLPAETMSLATGMGIGHAQGLEPAFGMMGAASFGLSNDIEIGTVFLPLQLSPVVAYDLPSFHAIIRAKHGEYELGVSTELVVGIQDSSSWIFSIGSPTLIRSGKWLRIDTGGYLDFVFSNPLSFNLRAPLDLHFQFTDEFFGSVYTGFVVPHFDLVNLIIPFGFGVGYAFEHDTTPLCDLRLHMRWPRLMGMNVVEPESFTVSLTARFFFYL